MKSKGRILFYNIQNGHGKLILDTKEKVDFTVDSWDDFEIAPEVNLVVECNIEDGVAKNINVPATSKSGIEDNPQKDYSPQKDNSASSKNPNLKYSVNEALRHYFSNIEDVVGKPPKIINTQAQLDFFLSRRFLVTAYNNLRGLDPSLYEHKSIKEKFDTLDNLYKAYNSVTEKDDIPELAFEMIFLRVQPEYIEYKDKKERYLNTIPSLTKLINTLEPELRKGEESLRLVSDGIKKKELKEKLKKIRGSYVDAIHERACMIEELAEMKDIKKLYTDMYLDEFEKELSVLKVRYKDMLSRILNYKAYDLDISIWKNAKKSKSIQEFFRDAGIKGSYSTKTFLRYYLDTLDKMKLQEEQEQLFELLEYLEKIEA